MEIEIVGVLLLNVAICLFMFYAGYYKAHAKIYKKVLDDYIRMHFDELFQDDVKNKTKQ